jgi:hypothetical protein
MRRWIHLAAALYPRSWRAEYGEEFDALLDEMRPSWRVLRNVFGGAIAMQLTKGMTWWKLAAAGAVVAAGLSFTLPVNYVSTATIRVTPQQDPIRPATPQQLEERAGDHLVSLETDILSRRSLAEIIQQPSLDLYREERRRMPLEDIVEEMRNDIHIEASSPEAVRISFQYPDRVKAQATLYELVHRFTQENAALNRNKASLYNYFWADKVRAHEAAPPPPPPAGENVLVLDLPSLPRRGPGPNRWIFVAAGTLLGLLAAVARQRRRGWLLLAASGAAGLALAAGFSFLLPDHYTSTAVMRITPPQVMENPLATPSPASAAERLRELEPKIVTQDSLGGIVLRTELYRRELRSKPLSQVVDEMRRDLRIAPLNPKGLPGAVPVFSISFTYTDRYKAQRVVRELVTMFTERNIVDQRNGPYLSVTLRQIYERKAGTNLEVLDPASLPEAPVAPNRAFISLSGLAGGLLAATLLIRRRTATVPARRAAR